MDEEEIWRPVTESNGAYSISSLGRLRRDAPIVNPANGIKTWCVGRILRPFRNHKGYLQYRLSCFGVGKKMLGRVAHRLVAEAFLGPRPVGATINHKDGDKLNNAADNLEYISSGDNIRHASRLGLLRPAAGEMNGSHKLTEADVRAIRVAHASGTSMYRLAKTYGVDDATIKRVVRRIHWKHVA